MIPLPRFYELTHPMDEFEGAVSIQVHLLEEPTPWQAQVYVEGSLVEADYFETEADALRWAAREVVLIACVLQSARNPTP